eukprot:6191644-Pleurochrysis_carterae.AAC.2
MLVQYPRDGTCSLSLLSACKCCRQQLITRQARPNHPSAHRPGPHRYSASEDYGFDVLSAFQPVFEHGAPRIQESAR